MKKIIAKSILLLVVLIWTPKVLSAQLNTILDIRNLELTKKNPAIFILDLEEGDVISMEYNRLDGDISKLSYSVINVHYQETIKSKVANPSSDFRVNEKGRFMVEFSSGEDVTISLQMYKSPAMEIQPGQQAQMIEIRGIKINTDSDPSKQLTIGYFLDAGDVLTLRSGDGKAQTIRAEWEQMAMMKDLSTQPAFQIAQRGNQTVRLYPVQDDRGGLAKILAKLKKKNFQLENLTLSISKRPEDSGNSYAGGSNQAGNSGGFNSDGQESGVDYGEIIAQNQAAQDETFRLLQEKFEKGEASQEEMNKFMREKILRDEQRRLEEEERRNRPRYHIGHEKLRPEIYDSLYPVQNYLTLESTNKKCYELNFFKGDDFMNIIFYYAFVSKQDTILSIIDEEDFERGRDSHRKLWDQLAVNIFHAYTPNDGSFTMMPGNIRRGNVAPPLPRTYPDLFIEDVDFAILDNQNKERFLQNKPYISYYNVDEKFLQGKIGTMDFIETKDVPKYACFKNNNKSTKVYFGIRFFAINKQNQNFDSF